MNRYAILGMAALVGMTIASPGAAQKTPARAAEEAPPARRNLILITVDSLRSDHLGCYAGKPALTPAINALAARGIRFTRAYTASASTTPSNASILTGVYPARHQLRHDLGGRMTDEVTTLAQVLKNAGYSTGAAIGSYKLDSDRGLDRGFEVYADDFEGLIKMIAGRSMERRADAVVEQGLEFIDGAGGGKPFFLWLNLYDPHYDYEPPPLLREQYGMESYQGEVANVDLQVGALWNGLRARQLHSRTDMILAGTHGEGLGDHGETGHGIYLFESTIRVPLLIAPAAGGSGQGRVIGTPVSLVDVAPTVLDLLGVTAPADWDGRSLGPLLRQDGDAARGLDGLQDRRLYVEAVEPHAAYGWSPLFAVVQGDRKTVQGRRIEAFDLGADPGETGPLEPIPGWARAQVAFGEPLLGRVAWPEAETRQVLEQAAAMDLPWADSPFCLDKQEWPDPRDPDRVALNDALFRARIYQLQGIVGLANIAAREVLESDPANYAALDAVLYLALRNRWLSMVLEPLEIFQCNYPTRGQPYHYLGHYYELIEQPEKAAEAFRMLGRLEPWNEDPDYDLAALYAMSGDKAKALHHLERAIALGATDFAAIRRDGRFSSLRDDPHFADLVGPVPSSTGETR